MMKSSYQEAKVKSIKIKKLNLPSSHTMLNESSSSDFIPAQSNLEYCLNRMSKVEIYRTLA